MIKSFTKKVLYFVFKLCQNEMHCLIIPKKLADVGYATFPRWKVLFLFVYLEGNFPPFFTPLRWQKNRLKTEEGSASYQDTHSKKVRSLT